MDEENHEENPSTHVISYRSPAFTREEVKVLVQQVEIYRHIILNKCTNSTTNHAKEVAWLKISKEINKQGFKHLRSVDSLKTKWENLKKEARKLTKNILDVKSTEFNEVLSQIVTMISETDKNMSFNTDGALQETNDLDDRNENIQPKFWEDSYEKSDESVDDDENERLSRSLNFAPQECSLLLKCVRDEKKHIFSKGGTGKAIKLKNNAWSRITYSFNKNSPQKRTTKVLRTKFNNMKRMAKCIGFKGYLNKNTHEKLDEDHKTIKTEPHFQYKDDETGDEDSNDEIENNVTTDNHNDNISDPLSLVLNGDSGIDSISHLGSWSGSENKEVVKLKLELLNYQLETAKLERQRVQEAASAETIERQSKTIETSLRLRAARLAAVAAELKLPPNHPALQFTTQEIDAQQYMQQFQ